MLSIRMLPRLPLYLCLLCCASAARSELLPIVNPSFEDLSRPLAMGEQTNGAGGAGVPVATRFPFGGGGVSWDNPIEVSGWRTRVRPFGDTAVNYAGVLNPPLLGGQPFVTGQDGQYVAAVQVSQMGQTVNSLLRPSTRYRLTFLGGIGLFGSDYHLALSLIAVQDLQTLPLENQPGVTRLAITQGLVPPQESFGTLRPYALDYTTPATLPPELAGRYIGVHLWGSDGIPRVLYDDFRLEATTVPEPTGAVGSGLGVMAFLRRRRAGKSACGAG
jgi:hypothetical protein